MSEIPLPTLNEGMLDEDTLRALFDDLHACARVSEVRLKGGPQQRAADRTVTLEFARDLLLSRSVRAAQVNYAFDGALWTDTLMALPHGFRVVRMRHEER